MWGRPRGRTWSVDRGTRRPGDWAAKSVYPSGGRPCNGKGKAKLRAPPWRGVRGSRAVGEPVHVGKLLTRKPGMGAERT